MNFFFAKEKLDKLIYKLFNVISFFLFLINFKLRKKLAVNSEFKNKHWGERCFIFGTGPSLKNLSRDDISFLENEDVFAVNSFYKIESLECIKPKYYLLLDNLYWGKLSSTFYEVLERYKHHNITFITSIKAGSYLENIQNSNKPILIYQKLYPVNSISDRIDSNMEITLNVVSTAILSAIYMGYKEIYLLGCDYNAFCKPIDSHAYNDPAEKKLYSESLAFYLKYYHLTTEIHYLISRFALEKSVLVGNATPGTLLDAYQPIDLSKIKDDQCSIIRRS